MKIILRFSIFVLMIDEASKILEEHLRKIAQSQQSCSMDCPLEEKILVFEKYKELFTSGKAMVGIRPEKFTWEEVKTYSPKQPRYFAIILFVCTIILFFTPIWYVGWVTLSMCIYVTRYAYKAFINNVKNAITKDYCPFEKWYDEKKFAILIENKRFIAYPANWVHALYQYMRGE
ncbi:MAG: hypothetical protein NZ455_00960 [Bacteroidia bacterium]|nr:hypothetical protein [Bacteroidia bacterium]MDW8346580.1 hypothetical protein [Bacteroidia bacterium]